MSPHPSSTITTPPTPKSSSTHLPFFTVCSHAVQVLIRACIRRRSPNVRRSCHARPVDNSQPSNNRRGNQLAAPARQLARDSDILVEHRGRHTDYFHRKHECRRAGFLSWLDLPGVYRQGGSRGADSFPLRRRAVNLLQYRGRRGAGLGDCAEGDVEAAGTVDLLVERLRGGVRMGRACRARLLRDVERRGAG